MGRDLIECSDCGCLKSKGYFPKRDNGRRTRCKDCKGPVTPKRKHGIGPEHPDYNRAVKLHLLYKMSLSEYNELLGSQGGRCAICGKVPEEGERALAVDHDHNCCPGKESCGQCVRGLLCYRCNVLLGYAGDSPQVLSSAVQYLQNV